ncbi:MAG: SRPBCC family protein [Acidobacteriota bacterium]
MNTAKIIRFQLDSGTITTLKTVHIPQEVTDGMNIEKTIYIYRPVYEVYQFWRRLSSLPTIASNLEAVKVTDNRHSQWVMKAPLGEIKWTAEIIEEVENQLISWCSLEPSAVPNEGFVKFEPMLDGRGTEVHVWIHFKPPLGNFGSWVANLFGKNPEKLLEETLCNLKDKLESKGLADTQELPVYTD